MSLDSKVTAAAAAAEETSLKLAEAQDSIKVLLGVLKPNVFALQEAGLDGELSTKMTNINKILQPIVTIEELIPPVEELVEDEYDELIRNEVKRMMDEQFN